MSPPSGDRTGAFLPARTPSLTQPWHSPPGGFDEETRVLLRWRLLAMHIIAGTVIFILALVHTSRFIENAALGVMPDVWYAIHWVQVLECVIGAVVLWRRPYLSLRGLRKWEFVHFGTAVVGCGLDKSLRFAYLPVDSTGNPMLAVAYTELVSQIPFALLVLIYGTTIPNTTRRSLWGVAIMIAIAVIATFAGTLSNGDLIEWIPRLIVFSVLTLIMPTLIAVFVASRNYALLREVYEARREAQQVGPYSLQRMLGKGGMGEVWLAEHRLLKRPCAVKFIRADLAGSSSMAARFEREVRAVTGLTHHNTIRIYDYGRADDGSFYYVMEYLEGPTLDELVRTEGPQTPVRVVHLLRQVCGALAEAHAAGLIHRDIKPGNILVAKLGGRSDVAKLLDFGLVHDLGVKADNRLTLSGIVLGTPTYMCPEQAGGTAVDGRGDVYSLGAVAFFALTGRPPFERDSHGAMIAAHLTEAPPDVTEFNEQVPVALAVIVMKCLAKQPADRYASAEELEAALAAA